jgi:hypothetical protein
MAVLNLAVDFRSRRFAFRGGRIMKKFKSQLFQRTNSSLLAVSPQESARLPLQSTELKNQHYL